ncbi:MAG TPA: TetR/AcrR family transcriptional regulator [Caulobacterales bacterium]|nr:TetR/AcrR family transcriptional regulator [Caulobacterales bacterium]
MTHATIDRRSASTRAKLEQAHLALIHARGYEAINVQDICAAAGVSRSAFYTHYADKDDLKRSGLDCLRRELESAQRRPGAAPFAFTRALFRHAREHLDLYRSLGDGNGRAIALGAIREMLEALARKEFAADASPELREAKVQMAVGACLGLLTWWLDTGCKQLTSEEIDAVYQRLVMHSATAMPPR